MGTMRSHCTRTADGAARKTMATQTIETPHYKLYPSPRNQHRDIFEHQVFVPHPYAIIDLDVMELAGKTTLFAACRLQDMKMGQLVSFEQAADRAKFERLFTPD
jgi:hypothetical protein